MSSIVVAASFTQNTGDVATGLTLSDIDLYLTRVDNSTGTAEVVWNGTQNPTVEIDNCGAYARMYTDADMDTYTYFACARYTGAVSLDTEYVTGGIGRVESTLSTEALAAVQAEAEDALETYDLDHLIQVTAGTEEPTDGSYLDQVMHKSAGQTFSAATDSLEAIRDRLASATVNVTSVVDGETITVQSYTTWIVEWDEDTVDLSGRDTNGAVLTIKESKSFEDTSALVQVQEGVGLLRLNKAAPADAAKGSLVINESENGFTLTVDESVTGFSSNAHLHWDLKRITTGNVQQVASGTWVIEDVVTRRVTA